MTYEEAKKLTARAEELAQAVKDGKKVEFSSGSKWVESSLHSTPDFFDELKDRPDGYRIAQPKTRRPWTQAEAEAHLGWLLLPPFGPKCLMTHASGAKIYAVEGWQVHPAGHPDQLKPAYVEE